MGGHHSSQSSSVSTGAQSVGKITFGEHTGINLSLNSCTGVGNFKDLGNRNPKASFDDSNYKLEYYYDDYKCNSKPYYLLNPKSSIVCDTTLGGCPDSYKLVRK